MKNLIVLLTFLLYSCNKTNPSNQVLVQQTGVSVCFPAGAKITVSYNETLKENVMNLPIDTTWDGKLDINVQLRKVDIVGVRSLQEVVLAHIYTITETHCLGNAFLKRYNDGSVRLHYVQMQDLEKFLKALNKECFFITNK
jgi:hypothetical protein